MGLGGGEAGDRVHRHGPPPPSGKRPDPAGDPQRLGGVGEVQARDGGDLQAAGLHAAVAAVAGVVGDWDVPPWQGFELAVERGLVGLDEQQVGGVLVGDQPLGVLTLGVERIGGDDGVGEVQAVQQRPEPGDLVGGGLDIGLGEDGAAGVVHRCQQVGLRLAVMAAAAQGLAIDGDPPMRPAARRSRARWWVLVGQPRADGAVQRVGVDAGQDAAHGRLRWWPPHTGQRVAAHPEHGQDRPGGIRGPLADRGQGSGAGQHRGDRDAEHADQRVPSAAPLAGVGELGEVVEQAAALVGCQRGGRAGPLGGGRDGG
jgi:hypothetical protein